MKRFVLSLILISLVAGCAGLPFDLNSIISGAGGGNKVNTTEASPDLIIVQSLNVIPNPPINAGDQFSVSFEIKNQDALNDVNDVQYTLYDHGICDFTDNIESEIIGTLAPLQTEFKQWNFVAPDNSKIGYLTAKCPIRFKVNYTYNSTSQVDVDIISKDRLEQLQKAGTPPSFTPTLTVGRGPIKIYFTFGADFPVKSNDTLPIFVSVTDKGTGLLSEIENQTLSIVFPTEFVGSIDCGKKFLCSSNICNNNEPIPLIKKSSPQLRCSVKAPSVDIEKTFYISGYIGYTYDVTGETSVDIKPTLT